MSIKDPIKRLLAINRQTFSQNNYIIDDSKGAKYTSIMVSAFLVDYGCVEIVFE